MNELEQDTPQDDQFKRGIGISFALHALLFSFFTLKAVFFTQESIDFTQAVRVDIVGLPDKIEEKDLKPPAPAATPAPKPALPEKPEPPPPPKTEKKPEPKPEPAKPQPKIDDAVNLEKNKAKQQSAMEKLKAMAALEKIKADVANEKKKPTPDATPGSQVKGNMVSPGTSLAGLTKLQHETYGADLDRHIKQHWSLPEWLAKRDLKAQARVYIDSRGNILDRKIVKSSGNPSYDEEVLATLDKAAPFPAPPDKFQALVSVDGILIGFPE